MKKIFAGVDLGGKNTSNTVVCYSEKKALYFYQPTGKNTHEKFMHFLIDHDFNEVFMDAPLSLPKGYFSNITLDFEHFYKRKADIELNAMSPMYLGAFTAQAIYIKHKLQEHNISCYEVYPKALIQELNIKNYHKKLSNQDIKKVLANLNLPYSLNYKTVKSMHHFDALLCWLTGYRYQIKKHKQVGLPEEGIIIF